MANKKVMRWPWRLLLWSILLVALVTVACNAWLLLGSRDAIREHVALVPDGDVALVLGTAPRLSSGPNRFFEARMDTAAKLWRERKARRFLLSGDNSRRDYDEVSAMKEALVKRGVPADVIALDHAGFRTLDSMYRAHDVFGVDRLLVVTDDWHLPRALFLAKAAGMDATGACFDHVPWQASVKTRVREWLSRVKAVADVYVLKTQPKFLGERVALPPGRS
jgi:SanA protein